MEGLCSFTEHPQDEEHLQQILRNTIHVALDAYEQQGGFPKLWNVSQGPGWANASMGFVLISQESTNFSGKLSIPRVAILWNDGRKVSAKWRGSWQNKSVLMPAY